MEVFLPVDAPMGMDAKPPTSGGACGAFRKMWRFWEPGKGLRPAERRPGAPWGVGRGRSPLYFLIFGIWNLGNLIYLEHWDLETWYTWIFKVALHARPLGASTDYL